MLTAVPLQILGLKTIYLSQCSNFKGCLHELHIPNYFPDLAPQWINSLVMFNYMYYSPSWFRWPIVHIHYTFYRIPFGHWNGMFRQLPFVPTNQHCQSNSFKNDHHWQSEAAVKQWKPYTLQFFESWLGTLVLNGILEVHDLAIIYLVIF